jgi:hypothetical protein
MTQYRGSRRHVLDWTDRLDFAQELTELLLPVPVRIRPTDSWLPQGRTRPREARLGVFGPKVLPSHPAWERFQSWWLEYGGNTPNWDIACSCWIDGTPGLILVEAKANFSELKSDAKTLSLKASPRSKGNHVRITAAIAEACTALRVIDPAIHIGCHSHYQLSNRIAFTWRLASLGIPTVLVYLGFLGDRGISDAGRPFLTESDWRRTVSQHMNGVFPDSLLEKRLDLEAPAWILVRSRTVLSQSPLPNKRPTLPKNLH